MFWPGAPNHQAACGRAAEVDSTLSRVAIIIGVKILNPACEDNLFWFVNIDLCFAQIILRLLLVTIL